MAETTQGTAIRQAESFELLYGLFSHFELQQKVSPDDFQKLVKTHLAAEKFLYGERGRM